MPELPEVETIRREMELSLLRDTIQNVEVRERRLRTLIVPEFETKLKNLTISSLKRRAKYILISFEATPLTLVLHLGMSGRIAITLPSSLSPPSYPQKHEHVIFTFSSGHKMRFYDPRRFGAMTLSLTADQLFSRIGPEPLSEDFTADILSQALKYKKTLIKSALLDQQVVAGLGNIYVCEALHQAGIHPERRAQNLTMAENIALVIAIKEILESAISAGGSTLRDHKRTNEESGAFQHKFKVYNQKGKNCLTCQKGVIERLIQANRSTFFCGYCQV